MTDGKLTFANIVATPTDTSWSQAYTAGKLYAVLSLEGEEGNGAKLASIGKDIINALVEEFFTLETKDLTTIKHAVANTVTKFPDDIQGCLVVISVVNNILYAFSYGGGSVVLKRDEKQAVILHPKQEPQHEVTAVSGYLQSGDLIMIQTKQFSDTVSEQDTTAFTTPAEAVEVLSPKIHGTTAGGASAIILSYLQEEKPQETLPTAFPTEPDEEKEEEEELPSALEDEVAHKQPLKKPFALPNMGVSFPKLSIKLPKKAFLLLLIPLLLLGILGFSIYTTKQNQETERIQKLFDSVYPQAEKKYEEGQALLSLNEQLAQDDFREAKEILETNKNKFPQGSAQEQKITELLTKVHAVVTEDANGTTLEASETESSNSPLLAALLKNNAQYATQSDTTIYTGTNASIKTADGKTVIPREDTWEQMAGLGAFGTNLYVLDKTGNQIVKFLGGSAESKSVYASGSFAKAVAMAIDSSIYVLSSDGTVKKYTRGTPDTFAITGLETPFKTPIRIFTTADTDNVYILDPGTARVVALSKAGAFQNAYTAEVIKNAKDFAVDEAGKKIYVLANSKVYEIAIP